MKPRPSRGSVLVEFALCFPVSVIALAFFIQVLLIQQTRARLNQAAYLAAREYSLTLDTARAESAALSSWNNPGDSLADIAIEFIQRHDTVLGAEVQADITASFRLLPVPVVREFFTSAGQPDGTLALRSSAAAPSAF